MNVARLIWVGLAICLGWGAAGTSQSRARLDPVAIKAQIGEILAQPPFYSERTRYQYEYRGDIEGPDAPSLDLGFLEFLADMVVLLARFVELLLWAVVVAVAVALVVYRERWLRLIPSLRHRSPVVSLPRAIFGEEERAEALPEDVVAMARSLFARGEARACLSLLYRGALVYFITEHHVELPDSATEGDCLSATRAVASAPKIEYFAGLTAAWQRAAYAGREPSFEQAEALCEGWRLNLGGLS